MKRIVAIAALVLALQTQPTLADLDGTRLQARYDRKCAALGRSYERHGLTPREQQRLTRKNCKQVDGRWVSSLYFSA